MALFWPQGKSSASRALWGLELAKLATSWLLDGGRHLTLMEN